MIPPPRMSGRARPVTPTRGPPTRGKNSPPPPAPHDPPRRRAHPRRGPGTYANARPPLMRIISRDTGEPRVWVGAHAKTRPCAALIAEPVSTGRTPLSTDAWQSDRGRHPSHTTVRHGIHVATHAAMVNATRVIPYLIRRMCVGTWSAHTDYT
jgi:hypothetical protein